MRDPIIHCELYKYDGCSHVDGFLCNIETCAERLEWVEFLRREKPEEIEEPRKKILKSLRGAPENKILE